MTCLMDEIDVAAANPTDARGFTGVPRVNGGVRTNNPPDATDPGAPATVHPQLPDFGSWNAEPTLFSFTVTRDGKVDEVFKFAGGFTCKSPLGHVEMN